jgi:hypothetical protein
MHATEMLFSPGTPSLSVTTRRRFTPQGTSCSALQAVTQPLHSMQRSESQMNFMRAMVKPSSMVVLQDIRAMVVGPKVQGPQAVAFSIWQTVVLVSCIIVTLS